MDDKKRKRVEELMGFIHSDMINPDKFYVTVSDCILLLESQWEEFCAGSEEAFMIQRENDIINAVASQIMSNREIKGTAKS